MGMPSWMYSESWELLGLQTGTAATPAVQKNFGLVYFQGCLWLFPLVDLMIINIEDLDVPGLDETILET